ncbi:MAG: outer membrane beta-barrel protein [Bacteroidales bacterium]|nr:outer membrane beta-barrel protein [Bacteroidales bacterium]
MKKNYLIVSKALIITLLLSLPSVFFGQNTNLDDNDKCYYQWYLNANLGITQSFCDIQDGSFQLDMLNKDEMAFGFGGRLGKHISPVFTIYGSLISAPLKGIRESRDLKFEAKLTDYIGGVTINFSNLFFGYKPRTITFYGTTGIGFVDFRTKCTKISDDSYVSGFGYKNNGDDESDKTSEAMVPTGLGLNFRINNRWDVNLESTIRWFDSDKLDGLISGNKNDAYYYSSLGVSYNFWRPGGGGGLKKMQKEFERVKLLTTPSILELKGDSVLAVVKGTIPEKYFHKKATIDFTPVLVYEGGSTTLKSIKLKGESVEGDGIVINSTTGGTFTYTEKIAYKPAMDKCELFVNPKATIGTKSLDLGERKLADGLILTCKRILDDEEFILAAHGYTKGKTISKNATIYFLINKHNLNWKLPLNKNQQAIDKITALNEFLAQGWEIKDITINAWASPDGEESFNQGLSEKRGETAKKYLADQIKKLIKQQAKEQNIDIKDLEQDIKYNVNANGEDWNGFIKSIKASGIKDKNIILNVINSQPDITKREQEIRNMTVIYKEIADDILPSLRRAEITITCNEPTKTDEEIATLATTNPESLDIKELLFAATLTTDLNTQLNIYKTVISTYPNDWKAFNNAGYVSDKLGNIDEAASYFNKAKALAANNGILLNNIGATAAKKKDYNTAKTNYLAAQKQGVNVSYNLGILKILDGNYTGALSSFTGKKCNYNVALAQLLTTNFTGASNTLNCAPKNAQSYYLMAIVGARTANESMLYENLKKAISEDPSYKEQAKEDREFIKYYSNPDFQNVTR